MGIDRSLEYPHRFCTNNRALIAESAVCGCFSCQTMFRGTEIIEWTFERDRTKPNTAICPYCGVDAVLPSPPLELSAEFLAAMYHYWFE